MAEQIRGETVKADFNDPLAVVHYARAAHFLGLWASEGVILDRFFSERDTVLLEAGCGAGRLTVGLAERGFRRIVAFDFAEDMVEQARSLLEQRGVTNASVQVADATQLSAAPGVVAERPSEGFGGVLFSFNGLMQIPGRKNRRAALAHFHALAAPQAPLYFTTHDRDVGPMEQALWRLEALRWAKGQQDPQVLEFGDRYFAHEHGRTFMHLPNRQEILEDLAATGWTHVFDALRREVAKESRAVRDFSDECRLWVAQRGSRN